MKIRRPSITIRTKEKQGEFAKLKRKSQVVFCYWQNSSKSIALSVWNATPSTNEEAYSEAVGWSGLVNGWYNIVTFLVAFLLVGFAQKYKPKYVHFICLLIAAIGFLFFPHITDKNL